MKCLIQFLLIISLVTSCNEDVKIMHLADYIDPLIGTDSRFELSNGNTYPAVALPWGMNFWTPQTNKMGDGWCYQYCSDKIKGIKQTHQASPWLNDYGAFSLFATTGKVVFDQYERESWFTHKSETVRAYYYSVYLGDYHTRIELTPTERSAFFRFSFPENDSACIIVDGFDRGSYIKILPEESRIIGYATNNHGGVPGNFRNYFVIHYDKQPDDIYMVADQKINTDVLESDCDHAGAILRFRTSKNEQIHLQVASSFISWEQAELNLAREIGQQSFENVMEDAKESWNNHMQRIQVEGGTKAQLRTFYTALYRTMLFPRTFYEINEKEEIVHYSPYNGEICNGYMFTDNGFWDTFRAVFPFFNLAFREMNAKFMSGLANTYRESGWLPEWASPGHRNVMIGSNSASLIADAYLKGIKIPDIDLLYEGILKNSENEGPMHSVGRHGVAFYNKMGYIPYDVGIRENTARTLEYAYDDYTIAELAQALNRPEDEIRRFRERSMNYINVFDPSVNFMRGRNQDGTFQSPFRPDKWGDAFTEGCSWHWTWCVFHDIQGLISLMGGHEAFIDKLDSVFKTAPTSDHSYYGFQIHEITEMKIINMGQYAHGNQPIQHMPYLYNYAGQPWKTQYHVREIMDRLYSDEADGLCGDEDNGQTSAWFVFSALGMYPVTPGSGQYVIGSPLFKRASIQLENGNIFHIKAPDNGPGKRYIRNAKFNRMNFTKNYLEHDEIMNGGTLYLEMDTVPNLDKGITRADFPYSFSVK
ncbi:GH92 family glycosyl hydrolase [Bacteroidota bacterium]